VAIAAVSSRLIVSLLFGLSPTDATTIVEAVAVLVIVSAVAGYLPARRAARVDPLVALHYE
jgi:ABC-type antimicrobial peptide transport system permease subunit